MCIPDSASDLDQFSDMTYKQDLPKSKIYRHIQCISNKIGTFHCCIQCKSIALLHKRFSIIAGSHWQYLIPFRFSDIYFHTYRIKKCLVTHRFHDPCGSQYRNTSYYPQFGIKSLFGKSDSIRNTDDYFQTGITLFRKLIPYRSDCLQYHPSGNTIDCRCSDRLIQPRFGDPSHACSTIYHDFRSADPGNGCIDQCTVCHIRIISGILPDGTGNFIFS